MLIFTKDNNNYIPDNKGGEALHNVPKGIIPLTGLVVYKYSCQCS